MKSTSPSNSYFSPCIWLKVLSCPFVCVSKKDLHHRQNMKAQHIQDKQCHCQSPESIPHTLPGLSMDDLIDSAQSSDLQTNRLFQLEKGVTATKPELSADDKSFLQATDVILNNGGCCWKDIQRLSSIPIGYFIKWVQSEAEPATGHCCCSLIEKSWR